MAKKINYASMYTLRADGRYMGYYKDGSGKRHAIYDRDPEMLFRKIAEKDLPTVVTFRDMAEAWEAEARETITIRTWKNYKPHFEDIVSEHGDKPCSDITASDISNDLLRAKARDCSATIVNTRRVIFSSILNYAVVHGVIPYNPALSVRLPKKLPRSTRRAPTDNEIKLILQSKDLNFGFFPFLLLLTGMRKSEALALLISDIDFDSDVIHVTKSLEYISNSAPRVKEPKTEKGIRDIPIVAPLLPALREYCASLKTQELFPGEPSNRKQKVFGYMSEHQYERKWSDYCKRVGLTDLTAHNLRHGTATLMFEFGVDQYTTQAILGHAQIETTMRIYTELRKKQQDKSISKFATGIDALLKNSEKPDNNSDNKIVPNCPQSASD